MFCIDEAAKRRDIRPAARETPPFVLVFAVKRQRASLTALKKTNLFFICLALCSCLSHKAKTVDVSPAEVIVELETPLYIERSIDGIFFMPQAVPAPRIPNDVGVVSEKDLNRLAAGDDAKLSRLFRRAYRLALMRDIPLLGVLGIDRAHLWPEDSRFSWTWVQNWRSAAASFDSWGVPGLVLAMLNIDGDEVFTVNGGILDMYGKNLGLGGANGALGYGSPRGDAFLMNMPDYTMPVVAQRFDNGLIYIDSMGKGVFIAGKTPSLLIEGDEMAGFYPTDDVELRQNIKFMFERAYKCLIDRYERKITADGPVEYLYLDGGPWSIAVGDYSFSIAGFFVQYYDDGRFATVLPSVLNTDNTDDFSLDVCVIAPPFSEILFGAVRLPSAASLSPHPFDVHAGMSALAKSFALYGIPLTNSFVSIEMMMLSQRFSKGIFHSNILY